MTYQEDWYKIFIPVFKKRYYNIEVKREKLTGVYFLRLEAGSYKDTKKLILVK